MYARGHFKQAYERVLTSLLNIEFTESSLTTFVTQYYKL